MKVEGGFIVDAPIDRVWRAIRDPDVVAPCIPGCQSVESLSASSYKTSVRVALGPIATTFNATVEITEEEPPKRLACVTRGEEGGKAGLDGGGEGDVLGGDGRVRRVPAPAARERAADRSRPLVAGTVRFLHFEWLL